MARAERTLYGRGDFLLSRQCQPRGGGISRNHRRNGDLHDRPRHLGPRDADHIRPPCLRARLPYADTALDAAMISRPVAQSFEQRLDGLSPQSPADVPALRRNCRWCERCGFHCRRRTAGYDVKTFLAKKKPHGGLNDLRLAKKHLDPLRRECYAIQIILGGIHESSSHQQDR